MGPLGHTQLFLTTPRSARKRAVHLPPRHASEHGGRVRACGAQLTSGLPAFATCHLQFMSDVSSTAVALKEAELGRRLTEKEVAAIVARGSAMAGGLLPRGDYDLRSPAAAAMAAGGAIVPPAPRK